jgi:hypothetical protein
MLSVHRITDPVVSVDGFYYHATIIGLIGRGCAMYSVFPYANDFGLFIHGQGFELVDLSEQTQWEKLHIETLDVMCGDPHFGNEVERYDDAIAVMCAGGWYAGTE